MKPSQQRRPHRSALHAGKRRAAGFSAAARVAQSPATTPPSCARQNGERPSETPPCKSGEHEGVFAEDWWAHARPVLEMHGNFRVRAELFISSRSAVRTRRQAPRCGRSPPDNYFTDHAGSRARIRLCARRTKTAPAATRQPRMPLSRARAARKRGCESALPARSSCTSPTICASSRRSICSTTWCSGRRPANTASTTARCRRSQRLRADRLLHHDHEPARLGRKQPARQHRREARVGRVFDAGR